jgi:hypothetical protein
MKHEQSFKYNRRLVSKYWWLFLPLPFLVLAMISCGSGGGEVNLSGGGIGGTGYTGVGQITALGSIFVNDIEFETASATVTLNGVTSDEKELQVGMVVKVEGIVNADGKTGKASVVVFDHNAEGPVNSIDLGGNTLEVMGQTVLVDAQTIIAGLQGNSPSLADLATNDLVEISGLVDADGNINATRITRKTAILQDEVIGRVHKLTSATFKINGLTVDYSKAILREFGPEGIQSRDLVDVKGDLTSPTTLLANTIDKISPNFKDNDSIKIEGFIDSLYYADESISGFAINTQFGLYRFELNASTSFSGGQLDKIKVGTRVKVEGTIRSNFIQANKLQFLQSIQIKDSPISLSDSKINLTNYTAKWGRKA